MSLLISAQNLGKSYGARQLFTEITLGLYEGERTGLIGPNGAGKTTLLKILAGQEEPDEGRIEARRGIRVGYVAQEDRFAGETPRAELLAALEQRAGSEHLEESERETRVAIVLTQIGFDEGGEHGPETPVAGLSGGWRKRLAIARELVLEPELLLLDEPTNHLDLEGVEWLEGLLKSTRFGFLVVTHDRYFLENVTRRIIEINPLFKGGYLSVPGNYGDFLERRGPVIEAQAKEEQTLKMKVQEEIAWLRRGPKAQRNKNKSRIKDAHDLIETYSETRSRTGSTGAVDLEFTATERKTRKLLAAHNIVKSMGEPPRVLIGKLNLLLSPGMRLGVLGPNGSGKSTLLRLLAGALEPDAGTIKRAPDLRTVFFDQQRQQLEKTQLLKHALAPDSDSVYFNGELVHVSAYARRFLFSYEQLDRPVGELSGGEQARVLIARLMLSAADLLILDEPTNDLDIASLEVLEEALSQFPGALVLVTHDRYMLDRLATEIVGLDGRGGHALLTDYAQYENWRKAAAQAEKSRENDKSAADASSLPAKSAAASPTRRCKLSFAEQKDHETIEQRILEAEVKVQECQRVMEDPATVTHREKLARACAAMHEAQVAVAALYERWQALESKLGGE